jgi:hypothetical protein
MSTAPVAEEDLISGLLGTSGTTTLKNHRGGGHDARPR